MAEKKEPRRGLGRGLSALMSDVDIAPAQDAETETAKSPDRMIPIEKIVPNKDQPRRTFTDEQLKEAGWEEEVFAPCIAKCDEWAAAPAENRWRRRQSPQTYRGRPKVGLRGRPGAAGRARGPRAAAARVTARFRSVEAQPLTGCS